LSLLVEFERGVDTGTVESQFQVDAGNNNDRALLSLNSSDLAEVFVKAGGVSQAQITVTGALTVGATGKAAARIDSNNAQISKGGSLGTQDTSVTVPASPTTIRFGANASGALPSYGYLRRAAIFSRALSDGELQALTAA